MKSIKTHAGTSMVEVLVTIVIVAFSLLGFAGLMAKSVKDSRTAYFRSQATFLSYSIVECMRANRSNAVKQSYDIAINVIKQGTEVAATDINNWKKQLSESLPGGDGSISVEGDGDTKIIIQWDEAGDGTKTVFETQTSI